MSKPTCDARKQQQQILDGSSVSGKERGTKPIWERGQNRCTGGHRLSRIVSEMIGPWSWVAVEANLLRRGRAFLFCVEDVLVLHQSNWKHTGRNNVV